MSVDLLKDCYMFQHGSWNVNNNFYGFPKCSICGYELHTNKTKYCPGCGAIMDGEST